MTLTKACCHIHGIAHRDSPSPSKNIKRFQHNEVLSPCHACIRPPTSCCNCRLRFTGKRQSSVQAQLIFSHDYLSEEESCVSPLFASRTTFSSHLRVPVRMLITLDLGHRIFSAIRDCAEPCVELMFDQNHPFSGFQ